MSSRSHERTKILKFLIVGGANTLVMYALYLLLLRIGFPYILAVIADYGLGVIAGYAANRYWTFRSHGKPKYGFFKYCMGYVGVMLLNLGILVVFVESLAMSEDWAQIPAIGLATIASYGMQRYWVFRTA